MRRLLSLLFGNAQRPASARAHGPAALSTWPRAQALSARVTTHCLWLAIALPGCGLAARHSRSSVDDSRAAHARELSADKRAPLAFERYRAAQKAERASDEESAARGDYASAARLWLELAIAQAERQVSSERRLEEERALVEADEKIMRIEAERSALGRENELKAARAIARLEAERALARAALRPELRVKLPREEVKRAAEALIARAELIALTLGSLGNESAALARLREKVVETRALLAKEPEASLSRADQTLFFALSLLASSRSEQPSAPPEERAALAEELSLAGLRVTRDDRGLLAVLDQPFAREQLTAASGRVLERLCVLAKAHPSGLVHVAVRASSQAQADARLRIARERLNKAECSGERFVYGATVAADEAIEASFLAY